ncbi:MAG: CCA tRNA nucleotidyltransferase [Phycisphaerales bacterium]
MARSSDPILARAAATKVVRALRAAGHDSYFAGGCVRDELLGLHPTDYDVATAARPEQVAAILSRGHMVGESFGVMLIPLDGAVIEVATFRSDGTYTDKRRPDAVTFTDARNDALRRDFTINAMFLDPLAAPTAAAPHSPLGGTVIDHVGGLADLHARVLRAVGNPDQRLNEDHLRALRAVRFAARLGLTIDPATRTAIAAHAAQLQGVSRERIGDELRRMLLHPTRAAAAQLLADLALDAPVLREPISLRAPTILGALAFPAFEPEDPPLVAALAAWALDRHAVLVGSLPDCRPLVSNWRSALCLSNAESDGLSATLELHHLLHSEWPAAPIARQKRLAAKTWFQPAFAVLNAQDPAKASKVRDRVGYLSIHGPGISPEPLLTGDDLVTAGFAPGPNFKRLLDRLYDEQLEGRLTNKQGAMELARTLGV